MSLMYELRKDPILGRWVNVAKTPLTSLSDYKVEKEVPDDLLTCPFCRGKESDTPPEIMAIREPGSKPNSPEWFTRVIPDFKPVLQVEGELNRQGVGMYDKMDGIGVSEIIIESPEHFMTSADMNVEQATRVLLTYKERILDIENDPRLRYILISKSYGRAAGAVYSHPHSRVIATPITPQRIKQELNCAKLYYSLKERCIFCDIMREEERVGTRVVFENKSCVAFCPFASAFPLEVWIIPRRHSSAFQETDSGELEDLGIAIVTILNKLKKLLDDPPYNLILHTTPIRMPRRNHWQTLSEDFDWHIEIIPRLKGAASFEWSSGFYILNTSPEEGAKYLKEV